MIRKDGREYQPVKVTPYLVSLYIKDRIRLECSHPEYYADDSDQIHRCMNCHTIVDPAEIDWRFEDDPDAH
jgi:hypothetical protein